MGAPAALFPPMTPPAPDPPATLAPFAANADGLLPPSPEPTIRLVGISQAGSLYFYGDNPAVPGPPVTALGGLIADLKVTSCGLHSRYGLRDYLDLRLQTAVPGLIHVLRLPCGGGQWSYRSLLGALCTLALRDTAVKLEAKRGRDATFIQVALDPDGLQRVVAPAIGASRADLEIAVNACRRSLGLDPQFP